MEREKEVMLGAMPRCRLDYRASQADQPSRCCHHRPLLFSLIEKKKEKKKFAHLFFISRDFGLGKRNLRAVSCRRSTSRRSYSSRPCVERRRFRDQHLLFFYDSHQAVFCFHPPNSRHPASSIRLISHLPSTYLDGPEQKN